MSVSEKERENEDGKREGVCDSHTLSISLFPQGVFERETQRAER